MKRILLSLSITLLVGFVLASCQRSASVDTEFTNELKTLPDLAPSTSITIDPGNEGDAGTCGHPIDSAFIANYLGFRPAEPMLWSMNRFTLCGKQPLSDSVTLLLFSVEHLGGVSGYNDHTIMTFHRNGKPIDSLVLLNDVAYPSDVLEDDDHYERITHFLPDGFHLRTRKEIVLGPEGDFEKVVVRKIDYEFTPSGKIRQLSDSLTADGERLILQGRIGRIALGATAQELMQALPNYTIQEETISGEGSDEVLYRVYQNGEEAPVITLTPEEGTMATIDVHSPFYRLGKYISVGSTFGDVLDHTSVTEVFGREDANVAVAIDYYPGVHIILDGDGLEAFPGKTFTSESIPRSQKVVGFYIYEP